MARFARVVVAEIPYHITHRGNRRARVFLYDTDREAYLAFLERYCHAQEALAHYKSGKGTPLRMSFNDIDTSDVNPEDFRAVKDELKKGCRRRSVPIKWRNKNDNFPFSTSGDQGRFLGNISLKLEGNLEIYPDGTYEFDGAIRSFDDYHDFNKSNHRGRVAELLTKMGSNIPGKPFWIEIRGSKPMKKKGKRKCPEE